MNAQKRFYSYCPLLLRLWQRKREYYGRAPNLRRDFDGAYEKLLRDYFNEDAIFGNKEFRRRFRMKKSLFNRVYEGVLEADPRFNRVADWTGKLGIHPLVKVVACLKMLVSGQPADSFDEQYYIGESTMQQYYYRFWKAIRVLSVMYVLLSPDGRRKPEGV